MENTILLDGLFRSGNTLLSSILNQNPDVHSTELTPLLGYMYQANEVYTRNEDALRNFAPDRFQRLITSTFKSYYEDIQKTNIIYRAKHWMHPGNFDLYLKYVDKNPKVIYTVRGTLDILASMILLAREHPFFDQTMLLNNFEQLSYLPIEDARCEFIMDSTGMLPSSFSGLYNCLVEPHRPMVHFVHYDDLVNYPDETLNGVYDFLNLPRFTHDFNSIEKLEKDREQLLPTLHKVRKTLSKTSPSYEEVLSPYIIEKYKNADFWKHQVPRISAI
jgi:hypothetical protein